MATIIVKQVKSSIKRSKNQKLTLEALGLKRLNQSVEHTVTPQILGMVRVVDHLVETQQK